MAVGNKERETPQRRTESGTQTTQPLKPKKIIVLQLLAKSQASGASTSSTSAKTQPQVQKTFKFDKERIVIGSVISADVRLTGEGVSPIHAVLEMSAESTPDKVHGTIFDLASDSGVFVNDKKVITQSLNQDDFIVIGRHRLKFKLEDLNRSSGKDRTRQSGDRTLFLNPDEDLKPLLLEDEREIEEIFDYRPASKRALEVVMSWCGSILAVEHFVREKSVTVGNTRKSNFGIPPLLSASHYPIATRSGGEFVLNLDAQMKGVMQKGGELKNFDEIRSNTLKGPSGHEIPLGNEDFAKVSIGDIDFYFSFTAAPPKLKRRKIFERDPFFQRVFFSSMVLTSLIVFSLYRVKVSPHTEPEKVPDRLAAILYEPEKFIKPPPVEAPKPKPKPAPEVKPEVKEPPKPAPKKVIKITTPPKPPEQKKPIPKVMEVKPLPQKAPPQPQKAPPAAKPAAQPHAAPKAEAKEGEGAKAKGAQGSRGEPNQKKSNVKVTELSRPSPHGGNKGAAGASQISNEGNVDILKGAGGTIQNILGNSAAHLGEGSENLKGFGNFGTQGNGGLALSGSGHGGGGDAETTLGGLGKKGSGMGRVGTGKGAAGNGNGIVGANMRVSIRTDGPEEAVVTGAIDRDAIAQAIYAHKDEFRLCYEREINAEHPALSGQIGTSFVIGASGHVTQAGIESSSLNNPNTERCVLQVLKRIEFPMPQGGGVVEVHFPFKFSAVK